MATFDFNVGRNKRKWELFLSTIKKEQETKSASKVTLKKGGVECLAYQFGDQLLGSADGEVTVMGQSASLQMIEDRKDIGIEFRPSPRKAISDTTATRQKNRKEFLKREFNSGSSEQATFLGNDRNEKTSEGISTTTDVFRRFVTNFDNRKKQLHDENHYAPAVDPEFDIANNDCGTKQSYICVDGDDTEKDKKKKEPENSFASKDKIESGFIIADENIEDRSISNTQRQCLFVKDDTDIDQNQKYTGESIKGFESPSDPCKEYDREDIGLTVIPEGNEHFLSLGSESDQQENCKNTGGNNSTDERPFSLTPSVSRKRKLHVNIDDDESKEHDSVRPANIDDVMIIVQDDDGLNVEGQRNNYVELNMNACINPISVDIKTSDSTREQLNIHVSQPKRLISHTVQSETKNDRAHADVKQEKEEDDFPMNTEFQIDDFIKHGDVKKEKSEDLVYEEYLKSVVSSRDVKDVDGDVELSRQRERVKRSPTKMKKDIDQSCCKWDMIMFARHFDFDSVVFPLHFPPSYTGSSDELTYVQKAVKREVSRRRFAISEPDLDIKGSFFKRMRTNESGVRLLLDAIFLPICSELGLKIEVNKSVDCSYLVNCIFDYRLTRNGQVIGCIEAKSATGLCNKSIVQAVLQLTILQAERFQMETEVPPLFNIVTDGVRYIFIQLSGKKLRFEFDKKKTLLINRSEDISDLKKMLPKILNLIKLSDARGNENCIEDVNPIVID